MTLTQILSKLKSLVYSKTETDTLLGNKAASSHIHSDYVPKSGGAVMTGAELGRTVNTSSFSLWGGTDHSNGAKIDLFGKDHSTYSGCAFIRTVDANNNVYQMALKPDGTLTWGSKSIAMQEDTIPLTGTSALAGSIVPSTNDVYQFGSNAKNLNAVFTGKIVGNGDNLNIYSVGYGQGALIALDKNDTIYNGTFRIYTGTTEYVLQGSRTGTLTWGSKNVAMTQDVIPRSLGSVMDNGELGCKNNTGTFAICSGIDSNHGGNIVLYGCEKGSDDDTFRGAVALYALLSVNEYKCMFLHPSGTWSWDGTACQITSDQRLKQQIAEIDDKLLDAWEDVELVQFKYNDAVDQKGDTARLHTGYVVQQIDEVCKSHNLDISAYGLYCHEEYPEETEEVEVEQEDGTKIKERKVIREASEHYSLRYTETLVVECAFLRREVRRLSERLSKLEQPSTSEN